MTRRAYGNRVVGAIGAAVVGAVLTLAATGTASAAGPTVVWQASTPGNGLFSADGSSVLLPTSTGFQVRRATDGVVQTTVTLPVASQVYDACAFSPDKQYIAIALANDAVFNIEIWRVSNSTLFHRIATNAVRNIRTLDFSSGGLLVSYERFAYGGGGFVRIFRVSDGGFVNMFGPYTSNVATRARFSPNGQYLALHDSTSSGIRVLRTSDWGTAFTVGNFVDVFRWEPDNATLWTTGLTILSVPYQQMRVPAGTVQASTPIDDTQFYPTSITADGKYLLVSTTARDSIKFLRTSDGGAQVTYSVASGGYSGDISPTGTVFSGGSCTVSPCTFYVAKMPAL
jgi:hypothetical protein